MAAPILASQTDLETSSDTVTLTVPSGTVDGDLLVAFISPARDGVFPITTPSGWTQIFTNQWASDGPISECYVRSASSEPASHSWTFDSSDNLVATMLRVTGWSGVIGDIDFYVAPSTELSTATIPSGAITGLAPDSLLIGWVACEVGDQSYSPPSGWTEFFDLGQTRSNSDRVQASGAYLDYASGGSSPAASFTNTADPSRANGVAMISVSPATGGVTSYDADISATSAPSDASLSSGVSFGSSVASVGSAPTVFAPGDVTFSAVSSATSAPHSALLSSGVSFVVSVGSIGATPTAYATGDVTTGADASVVSPQPITAVSASFTPVGSIDGAASIGAPAVSASAIASVSVAASSTTSTRVGNISSSASVSVGADIWPVSPSPTVRISAGDILAISDDRTYPIGSVVREIKQPNQSRRAIVGAINRLTSA